MGNLTLSKIDADITKEKNLIAAAQARLAKLQAAREIIAEYAEDESEADGDSGEPRRSLAAQIESVLLAVGPLEAAEIFNKLKERGAETTANSVNTTVSRMKVKDLIFNEAGKWDLTAKRRRSLGRYGS